MEIKILSKKPIPIQPIGKKVVNVTLASRVAGAKGDKGDDVNIEKHFVDMTENEYEQLANKDPNVYYMVTEV